jgi:hypothetical protein
MNTLSGLRSYDTVLTLDGLSQFDSSIQTQALLIDGSNAMESDINANFHVVKNLDNGVNASDSCTYGQMTTADTALSSALTASYTAADTAQTTAITAAYTAADNLRLLLTGGVMSGTVSSTTVTTPFDYKNPNGTIIAKLEAGTSAVTNNCTLQLSSNASSILEFRDNLALNVKAQLKYTYGTPGAVSLIVGGSQVLSASDTTLTCGLINMQNNRIFGLAATPTTDQDAVPRLYMVNAIADEATARTSGDAAVVASSIQKSGGTMTGDLTFSGGNINMGTGYIGLQNGVQATDAINKQQMEAGDATVAANATAALTTEVNARVAAVASEAATRASQDAALSSAYIAADSVVTNNAVQKTGSIMSGTLTINNIQTFLQATHTAASSAMTMQGGSSAVPNAAHIRMTMGTLGGLEFWDYSGVKMGYMQYDVQNTPDRIVFNVSGVSSLIVQSAAVICSQPLAMSTKQITGLQTGSAPDHAVNKGQMDTADGLRLALTGGTLSGALVANAGLTVNGAGVTVNAPTVCNGNLTINGGVLARNMWYPGETIQRKWLSPALSDTLAKTTIAAASSEIIVTTTLPVTANNMVIVKGAFEVTANNSANDTYRIEFGFSTQTVTFNNVLGAVNGYRTRYGMYEFMFVPTSSGTKTIKATLYNDSTSDTITVSDLNWTWTIEEIQG